MSSACREPEMHIAMVLASRGQGGLEKHVCELSAALVARGHRVSLLLDPCLLSAVPVGVEAVAIDMRRHRYHPRLWWQLRQQLLQLQPDIVHAQANKATCLLAAIRHWLPMPCVATLHNLKNHIRAYLRMDQVIAVSRYLAGLMAPFPAAVIYHGIVPPIPSPALSPREGFTWLAVGRLVPAKGFDLLLDAIDGLPLTLWIAGSGPEDAQLKQRAQQLSAPTRVVFLGQVVDVPALMQQSDGLVISSRREGFSYVCAEALLCRLPVLATDVPIANEVLPPAWVVPVGDVQALQQRMQVAMQAPATWRSELAPAFEIAQQQLTVARMVAQTEAVYAAAMQPGALRHDPAPTDY